MRSGSDPEDGAEVETSDPDAALEAVVAD